MVDLYGILQKIGFDWQVALANLVNFLIILFILAKFGFKPVKELIQKMQNIISQGLENVRKAETELMMADGKKNQIIEDGRLKADLIVKKAKEDGLIMVENARIKAKEESDKITELAAKSNEKEFKKMRKDMEEKNLELI